jgi:hypothetical protein
VYVVLMLLWVATSLIGLAACGYGIYQAVYPHYLIWQQRTSGAVSERTQGAEAAPPDEEEGEPVAAQERSDEGDGAKEPAAFGSLSQSEMPEAPEMSAQILLDDLDELADDDEKDKK